MFYPSFFSPEELICNFGGAKIFFREGKHIIRPTMIASLGGANSIFMEAPLPWAPLDKTLVSRVVDVDVVLSTTHHHSSH